MTERLFSPVRNVLAAARTLFTGKISGVAQGSGAHNEHSSIALQDEQVSMLLERRLVFNETLRLPDQQVAFSPGILKRESVSLRESKLAYLNSAIVSGPERPIQTPASTLTTEFGEGGFGQLGVGGTVNVSG